MNMYQKKPWYFQTWFICLVFCFWPTIFMLVCGIILLVLAMNFEKKREIELRKNMDQTIEFEKNRLDSDFRSRINSIDGEYAKKNSEVSKLTTERDSLIAEIDRLRRECLAESVDIEAYQDMKSDEIKTQLQMLRLEQKEMVKKGFALISRANGTKREQAAQEKQILRCFNAESTNLIESVSIKNADSVRAKLQRSFENINSIFTLDNVQISPVYLKSKLDELSAVYAYMIRLEEEKETARAIREQMQEEEKVRREIERQKQKLDKEESQFRGEITKLMAYMQKTQSDVEKQLYIDKIRELEDKISLLEKDRENVLEREQNTRAGFVYIISNIGSFGENVYKIGMTRRLEPMDRVKELGDASVPFTFDVHALIFSDDAPALETILHNTFKDNQVNKVNPRKEFFKVNLEEIKKIVLENHNATVHFVDIPEASDYRESLRLEKVTA